LGIELSSDRGQRTEAETMPASERIDALSETLGHADPVERLKAVQALASIGSPESDCVLLQALGDKDSSVRQAATISLLKDTSSGHVLLAALRDERTEIRETAARAVLNLPKIEQASPDIRCIAVMSLKNTTNVDSIEALFTQAEDTADNVWVNVRTALIGPETMRLMVSTPKSENEILKIVLDRTRNQPLATVEASRVVLQAAKAFIATAKNSNITIDSGSKTLIFNTLGVEE